MKIKSNEKGRIMTSALLQKKKKYVILERVDEHRGW